MPIPVDEIIRLKPAKGGKALIIGHRGVRGYAPDNTTVSLERGLALEADLIELDVHLSVVIHVSTVGRTTKVAAR